MTVFKVNLDYEASLFEKNYQENNPSHLKIIREFEYVYFLVEKEKTRLKNYKSYESTYLEKLKNFGFTIPEFDPDASETQNWWGARLDLDLERELNSKLTSFAIAKENNWGFQEGIIVENCNQIKIHLNKFPHREKWILKSPFSFSGIGHFYFDSHLVDLNKIEKNLQGQMILEPVYERIFDIGTTFVMQDGIIQKHFMVENFNNTKGSFKGGVACLNVEKFKKYIVNKYHFSLNELETITLSIAEKYKEIGARSNIQIDSFIYKENDELKLYPLVEVNYRKSMGFVIQALAEKYSEAEFIEWRIEVAKNTERNQYLKDWLKLSPEGNTFHSYVKAHSSDRALK